MADTWNYHHNSLLEYQILQKNPHEYFTNLFYDPYTKDGLDSFFGSKDSYWNDLKANVFTKLLSIFDIFSFGQYYVNVIFHVYIILFGPMAAYKVLINVFPDKRNIVLVSVFFIPSFFYWASGIHKEGLIFTGIALIIYHIYFAYKEKRLAFKRWLGIMLGLLILLLLRNFVLVLILPAMTAWLLANRWPKYSLSFFTTIYLSCAIIFFTSGYIDSRFDFPKAVVDKQQAFIKKIGNSSIPIEELEPTTISFLKNTPQAFSLAVLRPYPSDVRHLLSLAATVETELILCLTLLFLLFRKPNTTQEKNILYFCTFFSVSLLLAIGFSVNNLGAIVRYRSIIIPLVITIMAAQTDWKKMGDLLSGKYKKKSATAI